MDGAHVRRRRDAGSHLTVCDAPDRSEEHTSELQSQSNLVCRLLLEKKKNNTNSHHNCYLYQPRRIVHGDSYYSQQSLSDFVYAWLSFFILHIPHTALLSLFLCNVK